MQHREALYQFENVIFYRQTVTGIDHAIQELVLVASSLLC